MDVLKVEAKPDLREPIAVLAFAGWNDAATSATNAARTLGRRLAARRFATIDPEPFYDFAETRPTVAMNPRGDRRIDWPSNEFFYARTGGEHDVVVMVGVEPNLRWRTFASSVLELLQSIGVESVVTLGALLADVSHRADVRVNGTAADPATAAKLGLTTSRYEGPTGIVGVLHTFLREAGLESASIWANCPHYLTTDQNPPATLAILRRLEPLLGVRLDLTELEAAGQRWVEQVDAAVGQNPEIADYVRRLESQSPGEDGDGDGPQQALPPAADLVLDVEDFLRGLRGDDDGLEGEDFDEDED